MVDSHTENNVHCEASCHSYMVSTRSGSAVADSIFSALDT